MSTSVVHRPDSLQSPPHLHHSSKSRLSIGTTFICNIFARPRLSGVVGLPELDIRRCQVVSRLCRLRDTMTVYSFYIFDRHGKSQTSPNFIAAANTIFFPAECIYKRRWLPRPTSTVGKSSRPTSDTPTVANGLASVSGPSTRTTDDDAKLIFGTVFSLRNMVRKLGGEDDK